MLSKKYFLFGVSVGAVLFTAFILSLPDGRLHITFCNVGQGDAAYIRTPSNQDMLIDGGPDTRVLSCLGKHMPFYDRKIDVVVLTHPQKDHMQGLISVLQRYQVGYFIIGVEGNNDNTGYKQLVDEIQKRKIHIKNVFRGDQFFLGGVNISVLWPDREWVAEKIPGVHPAMAGQTFDSSQSVLGMTTDIQLNDFSYYLYLKYGNFDALFTGDGDIHIQPEVMKTDLHQMDVLKVPHHGSKTGMTGEFLDRIAPEVAVISVGKNSYGHPTREALELLIQRGVKIKRTDINGDVEVVSDGVTWSN